MSETRVESSEFAKIQKNYLESLPKRIDDLSNAWSRLKHLNWDKQVLTTLCNAAHKLHGSGQTFQFPRISDRAKGVEHLLQTVLDSGEASPEQRHSIDHAIQLLREAIEQAIQGSGEVGSDTGGHALVKQLAAHVAVIEDDPHQAALIQHWLKNTGYDVSLFTHPKAFADALASEYFNIALLDIGFHADSLEGVWWLEQLKGRIGDMPVIMMSARTDMVARLRALRAGAKAYLPKPLDIVQLNQKIQQLLQENLQTGDRILLVDDDTELLMVYKNALLNAGFVVETVAKPLQLMQKLSEFRPDAVVLDYQMPGCDGLELGRLMRQDPNFMTLPIVFVSASPKAAVEQEMFTIVGNAFLAKPVDLHSLSQTLRQQISRSRLVRTRIEHVSQRNNEKNLQNRAFFFTELEALIARAATEISHRDTLIAYVSVDQASYLKERCRPLALAKHEEDIETFFSTYPEILGAGCALGAMNYLLLLQHSSGEDNDKRLDKLRVSFKASPWQMAPVGMNLTISIGGVSIANVARLEEALESTETACARAIKAGGDRVEWAGRSVRESTEPQHLSLTPAIHKALQSRAFKLVYQPIVNLEKEDAWFEVLMRLVDEQGRVYLPAQFMKWLDSHVEGGSFAVDRFIIENSLKALGEMGGKASAGFAVIIKLAPDLGQLERLLPYISNAIKAARLRGTRQIIFALPESCVLKDVARAGKLMKQLNALQCGFMLEQIGPSGHSHHVIKELAGVDFAKLSPDWCRRAESEVAIRDAIKQLLQSGHQEVKWVASNIEDAKSFACLWELGLRYFQGYFIQHPSESMASVPFDADMVGR